MVAETENKKTLKKLEKMEYMEPTINKYDEKLSELQKKGFSKKEAVKEILNHLKEVLKDSQNGVEEIIQKRIELKIIENANQARKSVAGSNYQRLIAYSLIKNVLVGNIPNDIIIQAGTSNHPIIKEYATIKVGDDDVQKPDSDVLIYTDDEKSSIINFSCKTSLRERAGQTYRWKLLVDLVTSDCPYIPESRECPINRYKLQYDNNRKIYMCFVTSDLYDEVNNPQIAGMFNFFDKSYVTKPENEIKNQNIECFRKVIDFINEVMVKNRRS